MIHSNESTTNHEPEKINLMDPSKRIIHLKTRLKSLKQKNGKNAHEDHVCITRGKHALYTRG